MKKVATVTSLRALMASWPHDQMSKLCYPWIPNNQTLRHYVWTRITATCSVQLPFSCFQSHHIWHAHSCLSYQITLL